MVVFTRVTRITFTVALIGTSSRRVGVKGTGAACRTACRFLVFPRPARCAVAAIFTCVARLTYTNCTSSRGVGVEGTCATRSTAGTGLVLSNHTLCAGAAILTRVPRVASAVGSIHTSSWRARIDGTGAARG